MLQSHCYSYRQSVTRISRPPLDPPVWAPHQGPLHQLSLACSSADPENPWQIHTQSALHIQSPMHTHTQCCIFTLQTKTCNINPNHVPAAQCGSTIYCYDGRVHLLAMVNNFFMVKVRLASVTDWRTDEQTVHTDFAITNAALHYVARPKIWTADGGKGVRVLGYSMVAMLMHIYT